MSETPAGYYTDADAIRAALGKHGPLSRADLVKASDLPRDVLAKALYALKKQGDVIEEGELVMLATQPKKEESRLEDRVTLCPDEPAEGLGPTMAQDERKETESMGCTTQGEKIDSRGASGPAMGISGSGSLASLNDLDKACPTEVASHEHVGCSASETRPPDDFHEPQAKKLAAAISLLMSELPGLLEDREKLRMLREVLG